MRGDGGSMRAESNLPPGVTDEMIERAAGWEEDHGYATRHQACNLLLRGIQGETAREGLDDTPDRFAAAWAFWTQGYREDLADVLKTFSDGATGYDEMIIETDIPVYSKCEHHLADIFGVAHVGYIPSGRIVGLSKIVRVVEHFARRLQVQERMTTQIAEAIGRGLMARGVGVVLQCRHMCMESRGVQRPNVVTTTTSLQGVMRTDPAARSEFLAMVNGRRSV